MENLFKKAIILNGLEKKFLKKLEHFSENRDHYDTSDKFKIFEKISERACHFYKEIIISDEYILKDSIKITDSQLMEIFEKIKNNMFFSVKYYISLQKDDDKEITKEEYIKDSLVYYCIDVDSKKINKLDVLEFYYDLLTIGPFLLKNDIPDTIKLYFNEAKHAFALTLYQSSISMIRVVLELLLKKVLIWNDIIDEKKYRELYSGLGSFERLCEKNQLLPNETLSQIKKIRKMANKMVHPSINTILPISKQECFNGLQITMSIIEDLYNSELTKSYFSENRH